VIKDTKISLKNKIKNKKNRLSYETASFF